MCAYPAVREGQKNNLNFPTILLFCSFFHLFDEWVFVENFNRVILVMDDNLFHSRCMFSISRASDYPQCIDIHSAHRVEERKKNLLRKVKLFYQSVETRNGKINRKNLILYNQINNCIHCVHI